MIIHHLVLICIAFILEAGISGCLRTLWIEVAWGEPLDQRSKINMKNAYGAAQESSIIYIQVHAQKTAQLLVDPGVRVGSVRGKLGLSEPKRTLAHAALNRVRAVAEVAAHIDAEITADSSRGRLGRLSGTEHLATSGDSAHALPHHGHNRSALHVRKKTGKEGFTSQVPVVLTQNSVRSVHQLHGNQLEALGLKALDDLTNKTALHAVRLDHDEGALVLGSHLIYT